MANRYKLTLDDWAHVIFRARILSNVDPDVEDIIPGDRNTDDRITFGAWREAIEELLHAKGATS